jgi:hypothetical protein
MRVYEVITPDDAQQKREQLANALLQTEGFSKYAGTPYAAHVVLSHATSFFSGMWHNSKGTALSTEYWKYKAIAEVFPYTGTCYRIIGISLETFAQKLPSVKQKYPALLRMIDHYDAKDVEAKAEFYQFLKSEVQFAKMDSWAKSLDGINYFHGLKSFHTRNVIYKGHMEGGLDFVAFADALVSCGLIPAHDKRILTTHGAEEVIGYCVSPEPIKWRMVKKISRAAADPYRFI